MYARTEGLLTGEWGYWYCEQCREQFETRELCFALQDQGRTIGLCERCLEAMDRCKHGTDLQVQACEECYHEDCEAGCCEPCGGCSCMCYGLNGGLCSVCERQHLAAEEAALRERPVFDPADYLLCECGRPASECYCSRERDNIPF